jgi:CHAT domain-containing protein
MVEGRKWSTSGHLEQALASYQRSAVLAEKSHDSARRARALFAVSAVATRLRRYRLAIETAQTAKQLALAAKDFEVAGGAAVNISAVFNQLGDFDRAGQESAEAVRYLKNSPNKDFYARALLSSVLLNYRQHDTSADETAFDQAIRAAQAADDLELEALAWDERGSLLLSNQAAIGSSPALLRSAEESLNKAREIRLKLKDDTAVAVSKEHLAELQLVKPAGDYRLALKLINEALASPESRMSEGVPYYPIHIKARILQKLGDPAALAEFRRAAEIASEWRSTALPGETTNTQTVALMHDVYSDFALAAADASLRQQNPALAREALEVLAENRAANLREQLAATFGRNMQLPAEYFDVLAQLKDAQAKTMFGPNSETTQAELQQIRRHLQDIEIKIGISGRTSADSSERKSLKNSLRRIQGSLGQTQVLLSFCLGESESFLWAVTQEQLFLYRLANSSAIEQEAKVFTEQVRLGHNASAAGRKLSADLFSRLPNPVWSKPEWLIVADGGLLDRVPFAALPMPDARPGFISATHDLRLVPSERLLLENQAERPEPEFVGIGDPIYNLADSRRPASFLATNANGARNRFSLARLAGSGREIASAASVTGLSAELLTGPNASGPRVTEALRKRPEIIHIATHIVSPDGQPSRAAIALSLTKDGIPELLTPEVIATFRVPGSLVVLSGCSSEQGEIVPSEGLVGLSRAWLLAGAAAVVVSGWPTPDDSGIFFTSFYRHLRAQRSGTLPKRAAAALGQTQLEMQNDRSYRSSPTFWAAYSVISKE